MKTVAISICLVFCVFNISISRDIVSKDLTCKQSFDLIEKHRDDTNFTIIDLRPEYMYRMEHIENAIFFDVYSDRFDSWANALDKEKIYLLYCTIGQRSRAGLEKMKAMGFKNLYHLYEGLREWKNQGYLTVGWFSEVPLVEKAINNVFGWAVKKDFDLFFNTIANDTNFISVTPYNRVKFGFNAVREDSAFWGSPYFKALSHEVRDLKIRFSNSGDVAWFYCVVSDFNEWKGEPANWINVRWTGVLEKRNGKWRVVQQHFSYPSEN